MSDLTTYFYRREFMYIMIFEVTVQLREVLESKRNPEDININIINNPVNS